MILTPVLGGARGQAIIPGQVIIPAGAIIPDGVIPDGVIPEGAIPDGVIILGGVITLGGVTFPGLVISQDGVRRTMTMGSDPKIRQARCCIHRCLTGGFHQLKMVIGQEGVQDMA